MSRINGKAHTVVWLCGVGCLAVRGGGGGRQAHMVVWLCGVGCLAVRGGGGAGTYTVVWLCGVGCLAVCACVWGVFRHTRSVALCGELPGCEGGGGGCWSQSGKGGRRCMRAGQRG